MKLHKISLKIDLVRVEYVVGGGRGWGVVVGYANDQGQGRVRIVGVSERTKDLLSDGRLTDTTGTSATKLTRPFIK